MEALNLDPETFRLNQELTLMRRAEIDADIAQMAQDPECQAEVLQMEAAFAVAQWEEFQPVD